MADRTLTAPPAPSPALDDLVGDAEAKLGNVPGALGHWQDGLAVVQRLVEAHPSEPRWTARAGSLAANVEVFSWQRRLVRRSP